MITLHQVSENVMLLNLCILHYQSGGTSCRKTNATPVSGRGRQQLDDRSRFCTRASNVILDRVTFGAKMGGVHAED